MCLPAAGRSALLWLFLWSHAWSVRAKDARRHTVADIMTSRVHVASPTTPVKVLVRLMEDNHINAVPIVDQGGIPVGVVSGSGLIGKERRAQLDTESGSARDVMTSPPTLISADAPLEAAARRMLERSVRRLIVVDDRGKIAGIISRRDLLHLFLSSDAQLRDETE